MDLDKRTLQAHRSNAPVRASTQPKKILRSPSKRTTTKGASTKLPSPKLPSTKTRSRMIASVSSLPAAIPLCRRKDSLRSRSREVCGLTTEDIVHAFLVTPATLAQRIVRAKALIRDKAIPYQVPVSEELSARLGTVLQSSI